MKKNLLIAVILTLHFLESHSQIPNGGFEMWEDGPNYFKPASWWTNQDSIYTRFERDTFAFEGNYSLKILPSVASSWQGCASQAILRVSFDPVLPDNSFLTFYAKSIPEDPMVDSSVYVFVFGHVFHADAVIGSFGYFVETPIFEFERIDIPLSHAGIDEISIFIYGGASSHPTDGPCIGRSYSWIDGMSITSGATSINLARKQNDYEIYPNPSNGVVKVSGPDGQGIGFELYSLIGELVEKGEIIDGRLSIRSHGVYILNLFNADDPRKISTYKLIIME
jgi:hypothetical protein